MPKSVWADGFVSFLQRRRQRERLLQGSFVGVVTVHGGNGTYGNERTHAPSEGEFVLCVMRIV